MRRLRFKLSLFYYLSLFSIELRVRIVIVRPKFNQNQPKLRVIRQNTLLSIPRGHFPRCGGINSLFTGLNETILDSASYLGFSLLHFSGTENGSGYALRTTLYGNFIVCNDSSRTPNYIHISEVQF